MVDKRAAMELRMAALDCPTCNAFVGGGLFLAFTLIKVQVQVQVSTNLQYQVSRLLLPEGIEWTRLVFGRQEGSSGVANGSIGLCNAFVGGDLFLACMLQLLLPEGIEWTRLMFGR